MSEDIKTTRARSVGRPKADDQSDRASDLIESAIELVAEGGFDSLSMRLVALRAGVSLGLVRHYFGGKAGLISASNAAVERKVAAIFAAVFGDSNLESAHQQVEEMTERLIAEVSPKIIYFKYLGQLAMRNDKEAADSFAVYFSTVQAFVERLDKTQPLPKSRDRTWAVFQFIFLQLGPVLLEPQIANILGRGAFEPEIIRERVKSMSRMLMSGLLLA
ncbi:transcriptional regulator [marine gamma proteobacterium HTCC2143]|jgi:AcrR family transcriptional regulator|uniref:Transcriptional regulator n=1 Tax=marine gamma proteobacterium HTCC2143 TaxID=247633 RepID=A0YFP0_9GAMM|nr:transcriptional regulator [marine gamma proteobacterium HTCC2143]